MTKTPKIPFRNHEDAASGHPVMRDAQYYWCGLNDGAPPKRRAFEFMNIYQQAPHLLMSERFAPKTFSFIYCGTHVFGNFLLDLTGKTFGPDSVGVSRISWFDYK